MVTIVSLWLPILLSAVFVFIAASIVWMVMPHHKSDFSALPDENAAIAAIRPQNIKPGMYHLPYCKDWKNLTPEMKEKFEKGPVGLITVLPNGQPNMNKSLGLYFVYNLVVSIFVAYVTGRAHGVGAHYLEVFRVAGTTAILTYAGALAPASIWFGKPWSITFKEILDGVVYGLLVAGVFGWLWPR